MRLVIYFLFTMCFNFLSLGQLGYVSCSHHELEIMENFEKIPTQKFRIALPQTPTDTAFLLRIPVVFNVVHMGEPIGIGSNVSDEQLKNAIEHLNNYYQKQYNPYSYQSTFKNEGTKGINTKVEFYLASVDTNCSYFSGIRRINGTQFPNYIKEGIKYGNDLEVKAKTGIDVNRYLNVWIVNKINSNGEGVIGYAYYPTAYNRVEGFGCVISYNNINGILPHEIGHFLGLTHSDMAIGKFTNKHSYNIIRESVNFYKDETLTQDFSCLPEAINEAAVISINNISGVVCEGVQYPKIVLANYGSDTLKECLFKVKKNGVFLYYYTWEGSLSTFDTLSITLPEIDLLKGNYELSFEVVKVNGNSDLIFGNNKKTTNVAVAGFIKKTPFEEDFEVEHKSPLIQFKKKRSNATIQYLQDLTNSSVLLLEGIDSEDNELVEEVPYDAIMPWSRVNESYFASSSFCFNAEKETHFLLSFDRYQDSWGSSHFRVLANGKQVKPASSKKNLNWERDSVVISVKEDQQVIVTLQSSCDYAYETRFKYGNGSYVALDNLLLKQTELSPFHLDYDFLGNVRGCAPLDKFPVNNSFGVPMPVEYQYLIEQGEGKYDTIIQLDTPEHFKFTEEGVFGVHVIAVFEDGSQDSLYFPKIANTTKEEVHVKSEEHAYGSNAWVGLTNENNSVFWTTSAKNSAETNIPSHLLNLVDQDKVFSESVMSMQSIPYDFSYLDNVVFHFNYAYAAPTLAIAKEEYLSVKVSLDCGATWVEVYRKYGDQLLTTSFDYSLYNILYQPKHGDWKEDIIHLDTLSHHNDVLMQFDFHPSFGNALYIDRIIVEDAGPVTSLFQNSTNIGLNVYPNPVLTYLIIEGTDVISKTVIKNTITGFSTVYEKSKKLDVSDLKKGFYVAEIHHDNKVDVVKFLKE